MQRVNFKQNQLRITALWAFSEAFLGGILHAMKIPFSGLILAAFASLCICAIALPDYRYGSIIKATILVIIVKAVLSPVSPLAAYFAVFLQGAFAEIIFALGITYRLSAFLISVFALMQSAVQKIIILMILFGADFWKAVDGFLNSVTKDMGFVPEEYSLKIVIVYLAAYLLMGIITGIYAIRLPQIIKSGEKNAELLDVSAVLILPDKIADKKRYSSPVFWIVLILSVIVLYQSYFDKGIFAMIKSEWMKLVLRAFVLIMFWYFIITPLLRRLFNNWLEKKKNRFSKEVNQLIRLMPEMKSIVISSWKATLQFSFFKRISKSLGLIFFQLQRNTNEN